MAAWISEDSKLSIKEDHLLKRMPERGSWFSHIGNELYLTMVDLSDPKCSEIILVRSPSARLQGQPRYSYLL